MKQSLLLLLALLCLQNLHAQLLVDPNISPEEMVEALLGQGLEIDSSMITLDCPESAYGSFIGTETNLELDTGILLTTGEIANAVGPNSGGGVGTGNGGTTEDPLLNVLAQVNTFDLCALEFDFEALGQLFILDYVFGSEEYDDFVCSGVNDVFGYFIKGGPEYPEYTNIALLPGVDEIPVSINTINGGSADGNDQNCDLTNSEFYVENSSLPTTTIEYDGFTVPLTAYAYLTSGETYSFRLAIADGGDSVWDSGVFLQHMLMEVADLELDTLPGQDPGVLMEGCNEAKLNVSFPVVARNDIEVLLDFSGTATNGEDFFANDKLIIEKGSNTASLTISMIEDNETEGPEELIITLRHHPELGDASSVSILIQEEVALGLNEQNLIICEGESITIEATGAASYVWNEEVAEPNNPVQTFSPTETTEYSFMGSIGDCGESSHSFTIEVEPALQDPVVEQLDEVLSAPAGFHSYQWYFCGESLEAMEGATEANYNPEFSGDFRVEVRTENCSAFSECISHIEVATSLSSIKQSILEVHFDSGKDVLSIQSDEELSGQFYIFDLQGRLAHTQKLESQNQLKINTNLMPGLHFLKLQMADGAIMSKAFIVH